MSAKLFVFLGILLIVNTIVSGQESEGRRCVEGKRYNDGCNNCWCTNGMTACTLMACTVVDPETGESVYAKTIPPPDDFWMKNE